ncbi:MAG: DUF192 domain-containing protein [Nitrospirota bacterium]|nr:DUF192 domain-containing protein [Nitrospirota bacterium]MDE3241225.1 DUF192 domain-containing protein [Nitrospirota bacterium]
MSESSAPSSKPPKRIRVVILIVLALGLVTASWFLTDQQNDTHTILVTFPSGKVLEAEVADTPEKLLFGLAFREGLPSDTGMLYIFETSDRHRVKTKGFRFPVDMIWADESRHVVHIIEQAPPCPQDPCPYFGPPPEKVRYLIQTPAGFVKEERVTPGVELKFTLRLP